MESLLIDNNGVLVTNKENHGRIVVTNRDFNDHFGVLVRERPAIVWDAAPSQFLVGYGNFLNEYSQLSSETKSQILQLFHPPLDGISSMVTTLRSIAEKLALLHKEYDVDLIHKLLVILASNAHQYYGLIQTEPDDGNLRKHETVSGSQECMKLALYLFGSKVQHSCNPNSMYTSKTVDGALEYTVVKSIKAGEQVSFSYIGDLFHTPTFQRREKLYKEKDFTCMCTRCIGPDYCRVAKCTECGEMTPSQTSPFSSMWKCVNGCAPSMVNETLERNYYDHLTKMTSMMNADTPTQVLYDFMRGATMDLSPTHYVCIRGWLELATLYASKAAEKEQTIQLSKRKPHVLGRDKKLSDLSVNELRQKAASCGLRAISLIECVAENCTGCKPGFFKHAPVYESAARVFHVCIDLIELDPSEYPLGARNIIKRYLPLMKAMFGNHDEDVKKIESVFLSGDKSSNPVGQCDYCKQCKTKVLLCSKCYFSRYCSKECQVKHWKIAHKGECIPCS